MLAALVGLVVTVIVAIVVIFGWRREQRRLALEDGTIISASTEMYRRR